jgi:hypothetical protein
VLSDRIRAKNYFHIPAEARWSEIRAAVPDHAMGIPHYLLRIEGRRIPLKIPAWILDEPSLAAALERTAGPDNPLTRAFRAPSGEMRWDPRRRRAIRGRRAK